MFQLPPPPIGPIPLRPFLPAPPGDRCSTLRRRHRRSRRRSRFRSRLTAGAADIPAALAATADVNFTAAAAAERAGAGGCASAAAANSPPFRVSLRPDFSCRGHCTPPHKPALSQSYLPELPLPSSFPWVSLCSVFTPGCAGSGTQHPPKAKPCFILFTNLSNVPQAEEGSCPSSAQSLSNVPRLRP